MNFSVARLDSIARKYGTTGRHEAQARRHEQERQDNVMRQLDVVTGDKGVDRRDYAMVDGGALVNLQTGELPDVYGQFWWLDRVRLGRVASSAAAVRRCGRELRRAVFADRLSTLKGYVETNLATTLHPPQALRAVVDTPALQALAKRAGEVWMRLRDGGSLRLIGPSDADLLSLSQGSSSCGKGDADGTD